MSGVIRIAILANTSTDELDDYFRDLVENDHEGRPGDLHPALNLDYADDRAIVDRITVESVELTGQTVCVNYRIDFSAYHGCRDLNYQTEDWRAIVGKQDGDEWVFPVYVKPERLAPNEEL